MTSTPTRPADLVDWGARLHEQLSWHWHEHLRPRLEGLSDEEYLWEPVPGCWSLRPRREAVTPLAAGGGDVVADFDHPEPVPPPVTTIAWRMAHLLVGVFGERNASHFGGPPISYDTCEWTLVAADALTALDREVERWLDGVAALGPEGLERAIGPAEGPWAEHSYAELILHIHREAIHHGAEILLLRDLYAHRHGQAAPASHGQAAPASHGQAAPASHGQAAPAAGGAG